MSDADADPVTINEREDADGGMEINVDTDTEFGEQVAWIAGHRGETPEQLVRDAIEEFIDEEQEGRQ